MDMERRVAPVDGGLEIRADGDGEPRGIAGLAIPVNVRANIGGFTEEIAPSAVQGAIDEGHDIRALWNHDSSIVLARRGKTMTVEATERGLEFDIPELPRSRPDVLESIRRGDVDGVSWAFTVRKEEWDESGDVPHRTITEFDRVYELSPTAFPAYDGQTVVSARALDRVKSFADERTESANFIQTEPVTDLESVTTTGSTANTTIQFDLAGGSNNVASYEHDTDELDYKRRQVQALEAQIEADEPKPAA